MKYTRTKIGKRKTNIANDEGETKSVVALSGKNVQGTTTDVVMQQCVRASGEGRGQCQSRARTGKANNDNVRCMNVEEMWAKMVRRMTSMQRLVRVERKLGYKELVGYAMRQRRYFKRRLWRRGERMSLLVENAKFMLDGEEHFQELMTERLRLFGERNKEQGFCPVIEPQFSKKFIGITKQLKRPAVELVSTNELWIIFMKLRLERRH
ncbi:hypothetical protein L7F22_037950 [Adiantum nelumboides]|nr:hypothetical protein [Adiantum nelumboides]